MNQEITDLDTRSITTNLNIWSTITKLFLLFTFICAIITTYVAITGFETKHKQLMYGLSIAQGVTATVGFIFIVRALWIQAGHMAIQQEKNRLYWMRVNNFFYLAFYVIVLVFAVSVNHGIIVVSDLKKQIIG